MANCRMYSQHDRPSALVVTPEGPYIIDVLCATDGSVVFYHLIEPIPTTGLPIFHAGNPACLVVYDPASDTWDADAVDAMLVAWASMREGRR